MLWSQVYDRMEQSWHWSTLLFMVPQLRDLQTWDSAILLHQLPQKENLRIVFHRWNLWKLPQLHHGEEGMWQIPQIILLQTFIPVTCCITLPAIFPPSTPAITIIQISLIPPQCKPVQLRQCPFIQITRACLHLQAIHPVPLHIIIDNKEQAREILGTFLE